MSLYPLSAYAEALGDDLDRLRPELRRYFSGPSVSGQIGVGEGVFEWASSRPRWLAALSRPVLGPELFLSASGSSVPFRVENIPARDTAGRPLLRTRRTYYFPSGPGVFSDSVEAVGPGLVLDRLGARGRVEATLRCEVTPEGTLRMVSVATALRLGRLRVPLPRLLGVHVEGFDGWDDETGLHLVSVRGNNPLLGTIIEYRGSFAYRYEEAE
ncbi:hypothetical protein GCM10022198_10270 [Klugiella xanthotipulae]|uniref:Uncharacterized protein DUF4166 n=1 Tax=Klugiella xanthotipulae TaxID=244735 RepID=A0A543HYU4_9MICO|nr:DUF4166 domain-containing protein [Klugiella xanthotipulae]TQM63425.1 uncharacterized protein DUF4166 [Klugiella xanthotipulae]